MSDVQAEPAVVDVNQVPAAVIARVRELLRRAILTAGAIPDPDLRFRVGPKTAWPAMVQESRDAYGYAAPKVRRFEPTAADLSSFLDALDWLRWYRDTGAIGLQNFKLFKAWALGSPIWMLQERITTNRGGRPASQRTVHNRIDRVAAVIAVRFGSSLRGLALDDFPELQQKAPSDRYSSESVSSDLGTLSQSPKWYREPGAEPRFLHGSELAAFKAAERESDRRKRRANRLRKRGRKKKNLRIRGATIRRGNRPVPKKEIADGSGAQHPRRHSVRQGWGCVASSSAGGKRAAGRTSSRSTGGGSAACRHQESRQAVPVVQRTGDAGCRWRKPECLVVNRYGGRLDRAGLSEGPCGAGYWRDRIIGRVIGYYAPAFAEARV